MDKRIKYVVLASCIGLFLGFGSGCRKDRIEPKSNQIGLEYYPLSVGNTWTYRIDSIHFDAFAKSIDTFHLFEKQVIVDTFRGDQNQLIYLTDILRSTDEKGNYKLVRNQSRSIIDYRAEVVDSNSRYVSLVFPIELYNTWNPNQFNTKDKEDAEVIDMLNKLDIDSNSYVDVVSILHYNQSFQTLRRQKEEKYAKNIGLIYASNIYWTKKTISDTSEVPNGYSYTYNLVDFEN